MSFDQATVQKLQDLLSNPQQGIVIPHKNPDGDAMGSCLAWMRFLNQQGHDFKVVSPTAYPAFLNWLPGNESVIHFEAQEEEVKKLVNDASVVFVLDFNHLGRIDALGDLVKDCHAQKVMIDHHLYPDDFADITFSDTSICSTAQMVYTLIEVLDGKQWIDQEIGECLYTGIMTDTGSFKFSSTDYNTHRIAGEIIRLGVKTQEIHQKIYDTYHENRLRLLGHLLLNKLTVNYDQKYAYFSLTKEEMEQFHFQKGDSEGIVNYALSIEGIEIAAFFRQAEDQIRISFRSKGKLAVNTIASDHFEGGGHQFAAGGVSYLTMEDTLTKFKNEIHAYV